MVALLPCTRISPYCEVATELQADDGASSFTAASGGFFYGKAT